MNILIVSQYFWPENFRVNDLSSELVDRGHVVTVLTGVPNYPDGKVFREFKKCPENYSNYSGVDVVRVPLISRGKSGFRLFANYLSFAFMASILGPIKLKGKKVDVIFVFQTSPVTVGLPAVLLKYIKKVPVTFWALDLWPETLEAMGVVKSKIIIKAIGLLVSFIYNRCDLLLAQSRSFIVYMQRHCNSSSTIEYFPSWAEDTFSNPHVKPASEVPNANSKMFSLMFAGNIGDAQDFPSILNAAERLKEHKDIRFLIVGDGRVASWVKKECSKRGLSKNTLLLGSYPVEKMPSFYAASDALLVSLKNEEIFNMTIPGKLQSYMASAKPIIGMLNGEGADILSKSGAGFVSAAGDSTGLAENILKMAKLSFPDRLNMGVSGRNFYKQEFDKKISIDRLESLLLSTIKE